MAGSELHSALRLPGAETAELGRGGAVRYRDMKGVEVFPEHDALGAVPEIGKLAHEAFRRDGQIDGKQRLEDGVA